MSHVFILDRVQVQMPGIDESFGAMHTAPRVPEGVRWDGGSGLLIGAEKRQVVVFKDMDDRGRDAFAATLKPGEQYLDKAMTDADRSRIVTAFATPSPAFPGYLQKLEDVKAARARGDSPQALRLVEDARDGLATDYLSYHQGPLGEWADAYKRLVLPIEEAELARRRGEQLKTAVKAVALLVLTFGEKLAFHMAMALLGLSAAGAHLAVTIVTSDGYSGDGNMSGRAVDHANGGAADTWRLADGNGAVTSGGQCVLTPSALPTLELTLMASMATGYAEMKMISVSVGPMFRQSGTGTGYLAWSSAGLYEVSGYGSNNQIASGSAASTNDILACGAAAATTTLIVKYLNGATDCSATDTAHSTGVCGFWGTNSTHDNFNVYTDAAPAGQPTGRRFALLEPSHGLIGRAIELGREGVRFARRKVA